MPQKSGFFDTTADDPRLYPAREFAEYFARFVGNGIYGGGVNLKVSASGTDSKVSIATGFAWINGYLYSVFAEPLVMPIVQATTLDRIDRIVLRLNVSTPVRSIKAIVLQGTPNASPVPPALMRAGDIYDISLAQVRVIANTTVIQPHQVTDERLNNSVCGVVTGLIQQADTTQIFNEFNSWMQQQKIAYNQQWQDFMETIQDEGFASTQYVDNKVSNHADGTSVHGATSAATASRLIIRDAAGRAKVAAPSATDDIARLDSITKSQAGLGSVDNYGTATQAEAEAGSSATKFMTPQRTKQYVDTRLENNLEFRMNAGQLEYYNGTSWKGVGGELSAYPNVNTTVNPNLSIGSTASTWTSIVNINSKQGYFGRADVSAMSGNGMQLRITIDGVVKYFAKTSSTGFHLGVLPFYGEYASGNVLTSLPFPYINSASPAPTTTPFCLISGNLYFNTSLLIEVAPTLDVSTSVKIEVGYATN